MHYGRKSILMEGNGNDSRNDWKLKVVAWFIIFCVIGFVACVIMGILKTAIVAVVITGAVLLFLALLGAYGYEKLKNHRLEEEK